MKNIQGKRALVTGASSGLGADFARQLAAEKVNLVLVARRRERLEDLAADLRQQHGISVDVIPMDLGESDAPQELYDLLEARKLPIDILINNAGVGAYGSVIDLEWEREEAMLQLNILTLVHLSKLFARDMVERGWGRILQVASLGAYQACPSYASYGASKSFVLSFGEAFNYELRGTGVSCSVLSPGITATEFLQGSGQTASPYQKVMMMQSEDVVRSGLKAMFNHVPSYVPGLANRLSVFALRFVSRSVATAIAAAAMQNSRSTSTAQTRAATGTAGTITQS